MPAQILEIADVKTIFGNPAHPYTIGLLKAIPKLDEKVDSPLQYSWHGAKI